MNGQRTIARLLALESASPHRAERRTKPERDEQTASALMALQAGAVLPDCGCDEYTDRRKAAMAAALRA